MSPESREMEYDIFRAMNSEILLVAEGPKARQGFKLVRKFIEESEQCFSRFLQTSELSHINMSAGNWMTVSPNMFALIEIALAGFYSTGGLFDPSILPDQENAGTDKNVHELITPGEWPQPNLRLRSKRPAFDSIQLHKPDLSIRIPRGMQIDLGGIAKGWIAEQASHMLNDFSQSCAVSAGSEISLISAPGETGNWEIGLENPHQPGQDLLTLDLGNGAVATSSVVKRVWQQGNKIRHHLIDPRTGDPANTPWWSVTVLAPTAAIADIFAKAILIGGSDYARELAKKNPQITYIAVDGQNKILLPGKTECIWSKMEELVKFQADKVFDASQEIWKYLLVKLPTIAKKYDHQKTTLQCIRKKRKNMEK